MRTLVCARETPDALGASCVVSEPREAFSLRAGPVAFGAGAGSWAAADGTSVTLFEEAIYAKDTPPKRTWVFQAKSATDATTDAITINAFLEGTKPSVEVKFTTSGSEDDGLEHRTG